MFFFTRESFADITFDIEYFESEIQIQTLNLNNVVLRYMY